MFPTTCKLIELLYMYNFIAWKCKIHDVELNPYGYNRNDSIRPDHDTIFPGWKFAIKAEKREVYLWNFPVE
jgi:hypothetical protein